MSKPVKTNLPTYRPVPIVFSCLPVVFANHSYKVNYCAQASSRPSLVGRHVARGHVRYGATHPNDGAKKRYHVPSDVRCAMCDVSSSRTRAPMENRPLASLLNSFVVTSRFSKHDMVGCVKRLRFFGDVVKKFQTLDRSRLAPAFGEHIISAKSPSHIPRYHCCRHFAPIRTLFGSVCREVSIFATTALPEHALQATVFHSVWKI